VGQSEARMIDKIKWLLIFTLVFLLAGCTDKEWEKFKVNHHCKISAYINGDVTTGFGVGAKGYPVMTVVSTPDKIGWLCDDNITYFRHKD
jgi:hypothetical protein